MQTQTIALYDKAPPEHAGICFFDRGIPDVICHARLVDLPVDDTLHNAALQLRYNPQVFIFPPWEEIYCTDTERKQDYDTAVKTYEVLKGIYLEYGYSLTEVPKMPAPERAAFVIEQINKKPSAEAAG